MKLYVCWGTFPTVGHEHACRTAQQALRAAGYEPEVIKIRGSELVRASSTGLPMVAERSRS